MFIEIRFVALFSYPTFYEYVQKCAKHVFLVVREEITCLQNKLPFEVYRISLECRELVISLYWWWQLYNLYSPIGFLIWLKQSLVTADLDTMKRISASLEVLLCFIQIYWSLCSSHCQKRYAMLHQNGTKQNIFVPCFWVGTLELPTKKQKQKQIGFLPPISFKRLIEASR